MNKPVLYVFAISHYCEKARWALDQLNSDYDVRFVAPGVHTVVAKKLGARRSSLPILMIDGDLVQGSARIIDRLDAATSDEARRLTPDGSRTECLELEKRLDDVAGVHVRRYYYSEALVDHPQTVRPIFTRDLSVMQKLLVSAAWSRICRLMIKGMDLGFEQGQESMRIVDGELSWLDGLLSDGRRYLVGDRFSRADITAASLLAPLVLPREHPTYAGLELPPRLASDVARWSSRPSLAWTRDIYSTHRRLSRR